MTAREQVVVAGEQAVRKPHRRIPGEVGIWFFVAGDLIVFAVFFILIVLGQRDQAELFNSSRQTLSLWVGMVNTVLLLTGSWFVALGVDKCRRGSSAANSRYFSLAIGCGVLFVLNKLFEWGLKIRDGIVPGSNDFFMYFYIFTGIHLLHVLVGLGVLFLIRHSSRQAEMNPRRIRTPESGALFWHLVDLLWVVLFALFYLL